jgi:hypothetical protein
MRYSMRRWRWVSLILMATAVSAARPAEARHRKRADRCYEVRVQPTDSGDRRGRTAVVSASESQDLHIEVWLPEKLSSLPVQIKLFTPRGRLYQVVTATAAEPPSRVGKKRVRSASRGSFLTALVPLAGTQITTYALFGPWRAEAYLDEADSPCTRPLEFVIEP